jgi:hypothetical protein
MGGFFSFLRFPVNGEKKFKLSYVNQLKTVFYEIPTDSCVQDVLVCAW